MADLRQTLRAAADPPDAIDHASVRARARRITRWRRSGALASAAVIVIGAVWAATGLLDRPDQVRFAEQSPQSRPEDGRAQQPAAGPTQRNGVAQDDPQAVAPAWDAPSEAPLSPRWGAVSVWTGARFLVWGGYANVGTPDETTADDGASYDPVSDRWRMVEDAPIPGVRNGTAVWTGEELWVLGGYGGRNGYETVTAAAAYAPDRDAWRTLPDVPVPFLAASWSQTTGQAVAVGVDPASGEVGVWTLAADETRWRRLPGLPAAPRSTGDHDPDVEVVAAERDAYVVTDEGVAVIDLARPDAWQATTDPGMPLGPPATVAAWHDGRLLLVAGDRASSYSPATGGDGGTWREVAPPPLTVTADTHVAGVADAGVVIVDTAAAAAAVFDSEQSRWSPLPRLPLEPRSEAVVAAGPVPGAPVPAVLIWGGSRPTNVPFADGAVLVPREQ